MSASPNAQSRVPTPSDPTPFDIEPPVPRARYRADIDGLRALAVVAVILTHVGIAGFSGGYVGVDIFFVISGYLIYRDLVTRLETGRFSLFAFYGRRLRRTLPALYVVGGTTLVFAFFIVMPGDLDEIARSLISAVLLIPNMFFLGQVGYFDDSTSTKPLLHTWSLGVEEQFYLLAPLLPVLLRKLAPRPRRIAFLAVLAAALLGTAAFRAYWQQGAFYLMPTRAFEFLIGAALVEQIAPPVRRAWVGEAITLAAVVAMALAIHLFYHASHLPGFLSLVPCVAAAAIMHVGTTQRTSVGALLSSKPCVFLGLISYSLYLWHWPILVLARYADIAQTWAALLVEAILLLVLSILTWRYVERPFREAGSRWRRRAPVAIPAAAAVLAASAGILLVSLHALPSRFPPDVTSVASWYAYGRQKPFREGQCFITSKESLSDFDRRTCLAMKPGANVLLIGDSHAAHLWTGLRDTWPEVNVLQATASGCKPLVDTRGDGRCTSLMRDMIEHFVPEHRLDALVIAALWEPSDIAPLRDTIAVLRPHVRQIVVVGPMPRYDVPASTLIAKAMLRGRLEDVPLHLLPPMQPLDAAMHAAISPIATYVSPLHLLCPAGPCRLFAAPGIPMFFDRHHLTPPGANVLMGLVRAHDPGLFDDARPRSSR